MALRRLLSTIAGREPRPDARTKADVLDALGGEGCPVCRSTQEAVRRWFFAYENDTRVDLAMRERLGRSGGFCAAHTRHLLGSGASASWLARWVFADVARAGVRALSGGTSAGPSPCPACEAAERSAAGSLSALAVGLADPEVQQLLDAGDGLCVTHGVSVIDRTGRAARRAVASMLEHRLGKDPVTARDHLSGPDPDIARRRKIREAGAESVLAAEEAAYAQPTGALDLLLDWPCCPLCAAADRTEWRYLHWLAGLRTQGRQDPVDLRADAMLCPRHLGDLAHLRHPGDVSGLPLTDDGLLVPVAGVIEHVAGVWRTNLQAFVQHVDTRSWSSRRDAAGIRPAAPCQVCVRRGAAVDRAVRLMDLAAADSAHAARLVRSHGVCLRHATTTQLAPAWRRLVAARIGLLSYDLDESERKSRWDARWEARGAEMAVWRSAPLLLDGAVLGPVAAAGPAAAEPVTAEPDTAEPDTAEPDTAEPSS